MYVHFGFWKQKQSHSPCTVQRKKTGWFVLFQNGKLQREIRTLEVRAPLPNPTPRKNGSVDLFVCFFFWFSVFCRNWCILGQKKEEENLASQDLTFSGSGVLGSCGQKGEGCTKIKYDARRKKSCLILLHQKRTRSHRFCATIFRYCSCVRVVTAVFAGGGGGPAAHGFCCCCGARARRSCVRGRRGIPCSPPRRLKIAFFSRPRFHSWHKLTGKSVARNSMSVSNKQSWSSRPVRTRHSNHFFAGSPPCDELLLQLSKN